MGNCSSQSDEPVKHDVVQTSEVSSSDAKIPQQEVSRPSVENDDPRRLAVMQRAASRIQRQARKKRAMKAANAETQWKLFADIDTQDEAEMLHLAVFMQTLIDTVPGAQKVDQEGLITQLRTDETVDQIKSPSTRQINEDEGFIKLESIKMTEKITDKDYFEIGNNEVTPAIAADIVEVYRSGGKLSRASIVKVLRRAYKLLLRLGNITKLTISNTSKLTVVGDLHGQLSDLLYIFDQTGLPNAENRFIFNGDFVDRGEHGLEIIVILFAFMVAEGVEIVCLNRGNHEDLAVCRVYGFENEVKQKYDDLLFEMFAEVFNHLPLFSIANDSIFVVHGGLFHNPNVTMQDLADINRSDYFVKPPVPYPQSIKGLQPEDARAEYLKQLQRDALWSDPTDEMGCFLNPRGAGVSFGPDVAETFMANHNLCMIVRSHECVLRGFDLPFVNPYVDSSLEYLEAQPLNPRRLQKAFEKAPLLCTLFSASNYIGGDNEGAFLQFATHPFPMSRPTYRNPGIHYLVKRYKTSESTVSLRETTHTSLAELIMKRKAALLSAFEAKDKDNSGYVTRLEWADVMQRVTNIKIRWLSIISTIAPSDAITPTSVLYKVFLSHFRPGKSTGDEASINSAIMDDMYGQRKRLEQVFYFFDTNGDGVS